MNGWWKGKKIQKINCKACIYLQTIFKLQWINVNITKIRIWHSSPLWKTMLRSRMYTYTGIVVDISVMHISLNSAGNWLHCNLIFLIFWKIVVITQTKFYPSIRELPFTKMVTFLYWCLGSSHRGRRRLVFLCFTQEKNPLYSIDEIYVFFITKSVISNNLNPENYYVIECF